MYLVRLAAAAFGALICTITVVISFRNIKNHFQCFKKRMGSFNQPCQAGFSGDRGTAQSVDLTEYLLDDSTIKCCIDVNCCPRMNHNDFNDPLTFPVELTAGHSFH